MFSWFITVDEEYDIIISALEKVTSRKEHYKRVIYSLMRNPQVMKYKGAWDYNIRREFKEAFVEFFYSKGFENINLKTCKGLGRKGIEILERAFVVLENSEEGL